MGGCVRSTSTGSSRCRGSPGSGCRRMGRASSSPSPAPTRRASGSRPPSGSWTRPAHGRLGGSPAPRPGESSGTFLRDGSVLFTSSRPDPGLAPDRREVLKDVLDAVAAARGRWRGAACRGAPRRRGVGDRGGRRGRRACSPRASTRAARTSPTTRRASRPARRPASRARLFESFPIRYWDHYLGPRERRLFTAARDRRSGGAPRGPARPRAGRRRPPAGGRTPTCRRTAPRS